MKYHMIRFCSQPGFLTNLREYSDRSKVAISVNLESVPAGHTPN